MPMFKKPLIALVFIAISALIGTILGSTTSDDVIQLDSATTSKSDSTNNENDNKKIENKSIFVYVTGAVNKPGMVEIKSNEEAIRVNDAVNACGGLLPTADVDNLNMAEVISDGQHIRIPEKIVEHSVENQSVGYTSGEQNTYTNQSAAVAPVSKNSTNSSNSSGIVNINTAGLEELQLLKGIGPKMAERIIEYRQINGAFKSIEDIQNVKGIGPKTFERLKANIRI